VKDDTSMIGNSSTRCLATQNCLDIGESHVMDISAVNTRREASILEESKEDELKSTVMWPAVLFLLVCLFLLEILAKH